MKLLIAVLLAVFSTGAMAEWTYLDSSDKENMYIDKTTIHKQENMAVMWIMGDYKSPQKGSDGIPYLSVNTYIALDCAYVRYFMRKITNFSANMGKGQITFNHQYDDIKWRDIAPGSMVKGVWEAACKK